MLIREEDYIAHIGTLHKSGRYPWGSGGEPNQSGKSFLDLVAEMHKSGMTEAAIAEGMGMKTTELRARKSIEKNAVKQAEIGMAQRLRDKGLSNGKIGIRMAKDGVPRNESYIRSLLAPGAKDKADQLTTIVNMIKARVDETQGYIDVGLGVENRIGIPKDRLGTAVSVLKQQGYAYHKVQVPQLGMSDKMTINKVICPPGTKYLDVKNNLDKIQSVHEYSKDSGRSMLGLVPPIQISSKRLSVKYKEDGGSEADGVVYVRPGAKELSLGPSHYAQVRIAIDGTHYIKGMAMYKDDLPKGVDLQFNTNKSRAKIGDNKLDALKKNSDDLENPFTSIVHQLPKLDASGKEIEGTVRSAMNLVNVEGEWGKWSKNLSAQMLSKQSPSLAKEQLGKKLADKKDDFDVIMSLTNPAVRKKLLESYADGADSSALHLKAKAMPHQGTHVILPIKSMKDTEIFAPNFDNGTRVVLIRYPHGGIFEIPELTVNNKHPEANAFLKGALDAVGISSKVAERLSGADFDGDTVLVIPNTSQKIKTKPPLERLIGFDPQREYPEYKGMPLMNARTKGLEMGKISNLITDMTIKKANDEEISRAVRHSMVVIDAEKHKLNYVQSAKDFGITALKGKYQGAGNAGASTLISRATSDIRVPKKIPRPAKDGGPIDPKTGKKVFVTTNETYVDKRGKVVVKKTQSQKMTEAADAHTLSSGTVMEKVYADHANVLKGLANEARLVAVNTPNVRVSPSAKAAYPKEVASLNDKINKAFMNKPLERQAQVHAKGVVDAKVAANPNMDKAEIKKLNRLALTEARLRTGAEKQKLTLTDREWEAIQAGAITNNKLLDILKNADLDQIKALAMPRPKLLMTDAKANRAKAMLANGKTRAEVAAALGVSLTTLQSTLNPTT